MRARIEAGRRDGTLDNNRDADYAARFLMVLIMGLRILIRSTRRCSRTAAGETT